MLTTKLPFAAAAKRTLKWLGEFAGDALIALAEAEQPHDRLILRRQAIRRDAPNL